MNPTKAMARMIHLCGCKDANKCPECRAAVYDSCGYCLKRPCLNLCAARKNARIVPAGDLGLLDIPPTWYYVERVKK